jgi:HSP20 family protein
MLHSGGRVMNQAEVMFSNVLIGFRQLISMKLRGGYQIAIDLPGVNRDAVEIDLDDNRLVVKGARMVDESTKHRTERPSGKFLRAFTVPGSVDQTQIGAEYKDGVLQLRLPKRTEPKPQKVEIKITS